MGGVKVRLATSCVGDGALAGGADDDVALAAFLAPQRQTDTRRKMSSTTVSQSLRARASSQAVNVDPPPGPWYVPGCQGGLERGLHAAQPTPSTPRLGHSRGRGRGAGVVTGS